MSESDEKLVRGEAQGQASQKLRSPAPRTQASQGPLSTGDVGQSGHAGPGGGGGDGGNGSDGDEYGHGGHCYFPTTRPAGLVIDPDLAERHRNLEAALHGPTRLVEPQPLYWDGSTDQMGVTLASLKKVLANPPKRPSSDLPPPKAGATQSGG